MRARRPAARMRTRIAAAFGAARTKGVDDEDQRADATRGRGGPRKQSLKEAAAALLTTGSPACPCAVPTEPSSVCSRRPTSSTSSAVARNRARAPSRGCSRTTHRGSREGGRPDGRRGDVDPGHHGRARAPPRRRRATDARPGRQPSAGGREDGGCSASSREQTSCEPSPGPTTRSPPRSATTSCSACSG